MQLYCCCEVVVVVALASFLSSWNRESVGNSVNSVLLSLGHKGVGPPPQSTVGGSVKKKDVTKDGGT